MTKRLANKVLRNLEIIIIILLALILSTALFIEFVFERSPCTYCFLQRAAMLGVALSFLLGLRYGLFRIYYICAYISAFIGAGVTLYQILLGVCDDNPGYTFPILGLELYSWSFIIFICCIVGTTVLMLTYGFRERVSLLPEYGIWFFWILCGYLAAIAITNIVLCIISYGVVGL